jgi:hypothetical protein
VVLGSSIVGPVVISVYSNDCFPTAIIVSLPLDNVTG